MKYSSGASSLGGKCILPLPKVGREMIVCSVYSVSMKTFFVHVKNAPSPQSFKAARIVEDDNENELIVYGDDGSVIGKFIKDSVAGWWLGDSDPAQ